jgi:hypothetical protein
MGFETFLFDQLRGLPEKLLALPLDQMFLVIGAASTFTALYAVGEEQRFEKLRVRGMTMRATAILVKGLIAVLLLQIGLTLIQLGGKDIPEWVNYAVPGLAVIVTAFAVWFEVHNRRSFRWSRYFEAVVMPLVIPFFPVMSGMGGNFSRIMRELAAIVF